MFDVFLSEELLVGSKESSVEYRLSRVLLIWIFVGHHFNKVVTSPNST
jgi:hypothetical protein